MQNEKHLSIGIFLFLSPREPLDLVATPKSSKGPKEVNRVSIELSKFKETAHKKKFRVATLLKARQLSCPLSLKTENLELKN